MKNIKSPTKEVLLDTDTIFTRSKLYRKAIVSLVLGVVSIVSLVFAPFFWVFLCSIGIGIIGIMTGVKARKETVLISKSGRTLATAGIICSTIGVICSIVILTMVILVLIDFMPFIELLPYEDGHFRFLGVDW